MVLELGVGVGRRNGDRELPSFILRPPLLSPRTPSACQCSTSGAQIPDVQRSVWLQRGGEGWKIPLLRRIMTLTMIIIHQFMENLLYANNMLSALHALSQQSHEVVRTPF